MSFEKFVYNFKSFNKLRLWQDVWKVSVYDSAFDGSSQTKWSAYWFLTYSYPQIGSLDVGIEIWEAYKIPI